MTDPTFTVPADAHGLRLADFLARAWPDARRAWVRGLVTAGRVTVNRLDAELRTRGREADLVEVALPADEDPPPPPARGPAATPDLEVLAENELALVVAKPSGLPSVADRAGKDPGVHGRLATLRPADDLRIAHRLDRDTSGCLVLAKGLAGARALDLAFRRRRIAQSYLALVEGRFTRSERVTVERALGPDPRRPGLVRVVPAGSKRSRAARTEIEAVEVFDAFSLVRALPRTGRSHQIRVHLQSLGHPIVGDPHYGRRRALRLSEFKPRYKPGSSSGAEPALIERTALHAAGIDWSPDSEELVAAGLAACAPLTAAAELPADFALVLDKLRRFTRRGRGSGPGSDAPGADR